MRSLPRFWLVRINHSRISVYLLALLLTYAFVTITVTVCLCAARIPLVCRLPWHPVCIYNFLILGKLECTVPE